MLSEGVNVEISDPNTTRKREGANTANMETADIATRLKRF